MIYKPNLKKKPLISSRQYTRMYDESIRNPSRFWRKMASEITWKKKFSASFRKTRDGADWFIGGKLNLSVNCLDRHAAKNPWKTALFWEGEFGEQLKYTYQELLIEVCKLGNVLKKRGVKKGDKVCIYMPMIPEALIAMLACARIGAVHSVVFAGFSSQSLRERIADSKSKVVITADGGFRRGKIIPLKDIADKAVHGLRFVKHLLVVQRTNSKIAWKPERDLWWEEEMKDASAVCAPEWMRSNDPLFILYTSGSTGKARGIMHLNGGYAVYATATFKYIFDYQDDVYWCTADLGWITGHTYLVYGPLLNNATLFMYEGAPEYPSTDRWWQLIEKYRVNTFYTSPTGLRALQRYGDSWVVKHDLSSLRLLGSVGETIGPETWRWFYTVIGKKRCPIVDTWWQTDTGGIMISPLACFSLKPESAMKPFFGVAPLIVDEKGKPVKHGENGLLTLTKPWPGAGITLGKEGVHTHENYQLSFKTFYLTGDQAKQDRDGDYWLLGRIDNVLKVAGHRIGAAEVEASLAADSAVAEAAVVPVPHKIKGSAIAAFVVLKKVKKSEALKSRLITRVADSLGHFAKPDSVIFVDELPKNRSGKIVREILRQIAAGEKPGTFETLVNSECVKKLMHKRLRIG